MTVTQFMAAFPIGSVIVLGLGGIGGIASLGIAYYAHCNLPYTEKWLEGFIALSQNEIEKSIRIFNTMIQPRYRNLSLFDLNSREFEIDNQPSELFDEKAFNNFATLNVRDPDILFDRNEYLLTSRFCHALETVNGIRFSRFFGSFEPIFDSNRGGQYRQEYITPQV